MGLSWSLFGWVRLRLTSAGCARRLREIAWDLRLEEIEFPDDLTVEFTLSRADARRLQVRDGERLEEIGAGGAPELWKRAAQWKILLAAVLALGALTAFLPTRVWFVQVEGNGTLPARRILEEAQACGVCFGAPVRELRSEQLKNHLLYAIPELRWAGVNVRGCTATITVSERDSHAGPDALIPGDIVAGMDAVVTQVFPEAGTAQVEPGQAVKAGQILISGMTDLGPSTRADRAEGEVYGLTRREAAVILPRNTVTRTEKGRVIKKYALLLGKKRVNFSNDSGILHGSCVKMRTVNYLTLPGGFHLPAALVTETYVLCETEAVPREEDGLLLDAARRAVKERMTAGVILGEKTKLEDGRLTAVFECREMIGAFRPGVYLERDTNDGENGERGAG